MEKNKKELLVAGLESGTVIDHIPSEQLFKVVSLLKVDTMKDKITIGNNLLSNKIGRKGIIKIAKKFLKKEEADRIALIAPDLNLNRIEDYEVVEKKKIELPNELVDIVRCNNPKCITNNEPMSTRFDVLDKKKVLIKCHYCGKTIEKEDINLL